MLKIKEQIAVSPDAETTDKTATVKFLWIRAPKAMVYNSNFSDGAKLLYLILLDYQGRNSHAFPSLETLAHDTGKSVRRVQQLIKELEDGAAIEVIAQPGWVNLYRICQIAAETHLDENTNTVEVAQLVRSEPQESVTQLPTPMQKIAPLPMQKTSSELDPAKLDSKTVCEKSRTTSLQMIAVNPKQPCHAPQPRVIFDLNSDQTEVAELLRNAGVANADALRIASTNPAKSDVLQWIELAKDKANPGGYLAVVLGKLQAVPPPPVKKALNQQRKWQKHNSGTKPNQEAGAMAFMRRHSNEFAEWQHNDFAANLVAQPTEDEFINPENCAELAEIASTVSQAEIEPTVDTAIRMLVRQLDKQACGYLRQTQIVGDKLLISFVGNYKPSSNIANWLPAIRLKYAEIKEVILL